MSHVLITAAELAEALASPSDAPPNSGKPPVVLDVRWRLAGPPGHGEYLTGHIPGAVYVDLDDELARHGDPTDGRHPLPDLDALQASARRWGIDPGDTVVVYDGEGNLAAARAWWLLRWAGLSDVRLLDGALPAWTAAGLELATDDVVPAPGSVTLLAGALPTLSVDDVQRYDGVLLDARAPERYRGETEPIDPLAGHIPGAVNLPTGGNLAADGTFLPAETLRARFADAGADGSAPIAVYCGSGVTAAHQIAALAVAGLDAALYPGSWSQWSNLGLPVATDG
ncbi:sulfurtransferase [Nocardioides sp.]|uniref:sulfurtransferase n=1 Tax=Nocardioides sp. TaxID=35761 RepID=UPI0039E53448